MTSGKWSSGILALTLLAVGQPAGAVSEDGAAACATLAADGRTFAITAPGLSGCRAGFSVSIQADGGKQVLSAADGEVLGPAEHLTEETPYGRAEIAATGVRFEKEHVDLLFRLGRLPGVAGFLAQVGICNRGNRPVNFLSAVPVVLAGQLRGNPADWLVTNLYPNNGYRTKPVADIGVRKRDGTQANPADASGMQLHVWEYGGLYRGDGSGFLFGPVGAPIAYVNTRITHAGDGKIGLDLTAQMDAVQVDPGETRWGQQVVLLMEKPRPALARWAEWVGKTHGARTAKGALSGWSSWYFLAGAVTGKDVLDVADGALMSQDRLRPGVIQIDGGYEDPSGEKETNEKFAEGLGFYAQRIAATGARAGLQVGLATAPDAVIWVDPPGWAVLAQRVRHAVQSGFTYLKLDFYGVSISNDSDPKKTSFEVMREGFANLRKAAGEETYLLYCDFEPNRATVGMVDSSRTGIAAPRDMIRGAMDDVLRSYQLHDRWFAVDNCNYYMGTDIANLSRIDGGWPLVRTWMSMVGLSCGAAITSDPWYWDSFKPLWHNVEAMTPPATERTEALDLCTGREWPRLVGHVHRDWGDSTVALLWNPGSTERAITLDFAQAGLDPQRRYAVWSFWDDRYLGVARGSWTSPALAPSASQHLCFTDLDRTPNKPVLVGSNLHIYCGAAEIKRVTSSRGTMQVELTDSGARDGDLFVYSRLPLFLNAATGCTVTGVAQAGEYMWRISLADRKRGATQRVVLSVLLPVTQQLWFWLLIVIAAGSMVFAVSRYVAGLRFQRQFALDQERARIARDLHDEIGANLTHISILSTLAAKPTTAATTSHRHNSEVAEVARRTILAFDEILWSINPKNDTLQSLSHFICRSVEEILAPAGVAYHFALDESFPEREVPPHRRHGLLLAVKEALHNIIKHAGATRVEVQCSMDSGAFVVRVADDGCGFDPQASRTAARRRQGSGLENMRRRLAELGGEWCLESRVGGGTQVVFRMPLG